MRAIVIGASGFGLVHVRELLACDVAIAGIVGSTVSSARLTAEKILDKFGVKVEAFSNIDDALALSPDIVTICSPTIMHLDHLKTLISGDVAIFCEKPLFWNDKITTEYLNRQFDILNRNKPFIGINFSNIFYIRQAIAMMPELKSATQFDFTFHTNGPHSHDLIGIDLLPHAIACLNEISPDGRIEDLKKSVSRTHFKVEFKFSNTLCCRFDLSEDKNGPKRLEFSLDDQKFVRTSKIINGKYEASLLHSNSNTTARFIDPSTSIFENFVHCARHRTKFHPGLDEAEKNLRLMARLLEGSPK